MIDAIASSAGLTERLAAWLVDPGDDSPTPEALRAAKHALLDWTGVALAGSVEPVTQLLIDDVLAHGETGSSPIVGSTTRTSPAFAALVNGTASHALDYDDVNKRMRGHPTVTIVPTLLVLAQQTDCTAMDFLEAMIVGTEIACNLGEMLGAEHYERGFHATATIGTIAAAAAAARLMKLDRARCQTALGLAATQAAGLRTMFGTMAKPVQAGKAAMNGLLAARWAAIGVTGSPIAIESPDGFGIAHSTMFPATEPRRDRSAPFGIEQNIFKFHAACYYTHSAIEAAFEIAREPGFSANKIRSVLIRLAPAQLEICDIRNPVTPLEEKFSIRHLVAMALLGQSTADVDNSGTNASGNELAALREKISTQAHPFESRTTCGVSIQFDGQSPAEVTLDVGVPAEDKDLQETQLSDKFMTLGGPILGARVVALRETLLNFERIPRLDAFIEMLIPQA